MTDRTTCTVLHRPESESLCFLPEGPYSNPQGGISWVGIQHGADSKVGSLNLLDTSKGITRSFQLHGRPGFAFPTSSSGVFVCGVERSLGYFDTESEAWTEIIGGVDRQVENTIINDGLVYRDNLIFGCKDLEFATPKAGLYLFRGSDDALIQLRSDQVCSNGKAIIEENDRLFLVDIDSPTKTVTATPLDLDAGRLGASKIIVDVTDEDIFPDGLVLTPDGKSVIVAFYDPGDPDFGVARQYGIASGDVEHIWECPDSPRVTCPQLVSHDGRVRLVLTTAVEGMEPERRPKHKNAGCLFTGETSFASTSAQPLFPTFES